MNLTTSQFKKYAIVTLAICLVVNLAIIIAFKFTLLNSILLFTSTLFFLTVGTRLIKPLLLKLKAKIDASQRARNKEIEVLTAQGFKPFYFKKKHVVYAKHLHIAQAIYNKKIQPLTKTNPNKSNNSKNRSRNKKRKYRQRIAALQRLCTIQNGSIF